MINTSRDPQNWQAPDPVSTLEAARILGLAVRSVQLMVDRGDLEAWKTPGGHRRITRASIERWQKGVRAPFSPSSLSGNALGAGSAKPNSNRGHLDTVGRRPRVLLIEDSLHFQNLVTLLINQRFAQVELQAANDGIAGLAMAGQFQPDLLIVDILLPGIDGATLITSLRSHPQFVDLKLIVITSLDNEELQPYAFALEGVPVIHKPNLVSELPELIQRALDQRVQMQEVTA